MDILLKDYLQQDKEILLKNHKKHELKIVKTNDIYNILIHSNIEFLNTLPLSWI